MEAGGQEHYLYRQRDDSSCCLLYHAFAEVLPKSLLNPSSIQIMIYINPTAFLLAMSMAQFSSVEASLIGDGTRYGGNSNGGACGFSNSWSSWTNDVKMMTAAINKDQWEKGTNCGRCVSVQYENRSPVIIQITDLCPECISEALDLAPGAWDSIVGLSPTRVKITWDFVECSSTFVNGNLYYVLKEGSNDHWSAFQPQNFVVGIKEVSIKKAGSTNWEMLKRDEATLTGLFFVYEGVLDGAFQVSTTSVNGDKIVSPLFNSMNDELNCKKQFNALNVKSNISSKGSIVESIPLPPTTHQSIPIHPPNENSQLPAITPPKGYSFATSPKTPSGSELSKVKDDAGSSPSVQVNHDTSGDLKREVRRTGYLSIRTED
uniref:Carbohydratebinding protein putative n=1 Tax=Albugo laibachii Nc14 TaxID=890382 RepID=F0WN80_9STRA|nr:carbohydratebinding protein putative [Albugo laibachii Nc14]|eukprot:CCA22769.1 carbohydratebinding protein putative [Albugo laibachii Nc14]